MVVKQYLLIAVNGAACEKSILSRRKSLTIDVWRAYQQQQWLSYNYCRLATDRDFNYALFLLE